MLKFTLEVIKHSFNTRTILDIGYSDMNAIRGPLYVNHRYWNKPWYIT